MEKFEDMEKEEKIRQSPVILAFRFILLSTITSFLCMVLAVATGLIIAGGADFGLLPLLLIIFVLILMAEIIITVYVYLSWMNFYYVVGDKNISAHYGIISQKKENNIIQEGLDDITYRQSFFGRFLNYGDIIISEPRAENKTFLVGISDPAKITKLIEEKFKALIPE